MSKAHLKSSSDPLIPGEDQTASCGVIVPKAEFPFFFDTDRFDGRLPLNTPLFCSKCTREREKLGERYLYGLLPGMEMKEREAA